MNKNKKSVFELFEKFEIELKKAGCIDIVFDFEMSRNTGWYHNDSPTINTEYKITFRERTYEQDKATKTRT